MRFGGVVLCGGKSTRMGFSKAMLPFGAEVMLQRVLRLLGEVVVSPRVVVAAPDQPLPDLPQGTLVARDRREGRGPLEGLWAGLSALQGACDAVYATSCDAPRLAPAFARHMTERLGDHRIAVPCDDGRCHPFAAVYRLDVLPVIALLLEADRLRLASLFDEVDTLRVPMEELRAVDPDLGTLMNVNRPEDYLNALAAEGLAPPSEMAAPWLNPVRREA